VKYLPRIVDEELQSHLKRLGAVLITGPKACGKTETARQAARSEIGFDTDPMVAQRMQIDPKRLLVGDTPRLLDEWQEQPLIWNYVRHEVDDRQTAGQFILAGSANPVEDAKLHSGAGRISRLRMRPMTWSETGFSNNAVSLKSLLAGKAPDSDTLAISLDDLAEWIARGGWPGQLDRSTPEVLANMRAYLSLIAEIDLSRVSNRRRDPVKVASLLRSYARNISTPASVTTLATDVSGDENIADRETVAEYIEALSRLMIVEDLPAFNAHLRSKAALRKTPKRHFVDPSLAVAALGIDVAALTQDLVYLGFLFESTVLRDLRVYAQSLEARLSHYIDSNRHEADIILQLPDNSWAAFEVKLAFSAADEGARSLLRLAEDIDTKRTGRLLALTVITGFGFAHRRPDGVNVVPLATLTT
jgi:predicted AAA+ superfamily ATPase